MVRPISIPGAWLLALMILPANGRDLSGNWSGVWLKSGDALPVSVQFERTANKYKGSFDSEALQVADIPFTAVAVRGRTVHLVLKGDTTTMVFDGTLGENENSLEGTFGDDATGGTFRLVRDAKAPPQTRTRDIAFQNGDVMLGGTLLLPQRTNQNPAILFLQGSGPEARFANRWLAQAFARAGIVALIYDKRGVGQSSGNWKTSGFEDLAADAVAGVRFLASLPQVNPAKIGIYGHSQGGTLAPVVAVQARVAFVIASAAMGGDPAAAEEYSIGNSMGIASLPRKEAADARVFVHAIVDVAYRGAPRSELDALNRKFRKRPWFFEPPPVDDFYWSLSRRIALFHASAYWPRVKVPTLLLFGKNDKRVPPLVSSSAILNALHAAGNNDVTLKMFPNADHVFALKAQHGGWPKHVPDYASSLIGWTQEKVR
jgi:alpha-beta hydrolase superfamily lysophospholipase